VSALRLALSWLTVLPVRAGEVNTRDCRRAITLAPLVGALLGVAAAALVAGARMVGTPPLLAGLLAVGVLTLLTRGMHVDGLADTADGLGCYGPAARALAVMRDGGAGPFGVATLVIVLGMQAVALGTLSYSGRWGAVLLGCAAGRAAFGWCCRRGVPPARPDGMGALVASTQPLAVPITWTAALAATGTLAVPGRPWLGPVAVLLASTVAVGLTAHTNHRFGGITGDVLGAASELSTTVVLCVCALGA
jgi:adenosylcobinamide-GDP ribazoletransferase